ncbi:MAG: hypothetical protein OXG29_08540 [Gammaproteobacteria bacterium]|nr:hypothetical protein [Gammaproteobacteria bacterium]
MTLDTTYTAESMATTDTTTQLPDWLRQLRKRLVVDVVQQDSRSTGSSLLGWSSDEAFEAIGGGQACFDEPWRDLSPEDRVLLYCYLNQLGHLEELTEAFSQIFTSQPPDGEPIVIDLGCGPFTGGLAFAGVLGPEARFDYIGMDRSKTMRQFGENLAEAATRDFSESMPSVRRYWTDDLPTFTWPNTRGWRPVIVIVSYLLASPTLVERERVTRLVEDIGELLNRLSYGEVTVLYTNSPRDNVNRNYPAFRDSLRELDFDELAHGRGHLRPERTGVNRRLRYGLLYRARQTTLPLQEAK